ncbi:MAG: trypsin-like peptidase domain-containing protein [bacterium]|jgi:serine protease Do
MGDLDKSGPSIGRRHENKSMLNMRRANLLSIILFFIITLGLGFLGGWLGSRSELSHNGTAIQKEVVSQQGDVIRNIAQTVGQSVVSINVTQSSSSSANDSIFGFQTQPTTQRAAGTGIILTSSGYIVTNRHVVPSGATNVSVTLANGKVLDNVTVIGRTNSTDSLDIAILKINNTNGQKLVPANLGNSNKVQVGDSVVAIGNALGQFQNTVTSGIISGFGRSIQASDGSGSSSENLDGLFQTDAAINEGNSGGPLVNLSGQVIGINVATAASAQNIGFSIPINNVSGIIKNIENTGKFERPYLGVVYVPINASVKNKYNLSVDQGAYILPSSVTGQSGVVDGSPAAKAGLQEGDIITEVNGSTINMNNTLTSLVDNYSVGTNVTLKVIRNGKNISVPITVGSMPLN